MSSLDEVIPKNPTTVCFPRPPHLKRHPSRSLCRRYIRYRSLKTQIAPSPGQRITTTFIKGAAARSLNLLPAPLVSAHRKRRAGTHCSLHLCSDLLLFQRTSLVALDCIFHKKDDFFSSNGSTSFFFISHPPSLSFIPVQVLCLGIYHTFTTWRRSWRPSGTRRSSTYTPFVRAPTF